MFCRAHAAGTGAKGSATRPSFCSSANGWGGEPRGEAPPLRAGKLEKRANVSSRALLVAPLKGHLPVPHDKALWNRLPGARRQQPPHGLFH